MSNFKHIVGIIVSAILLFIFYTTSTINTKFFYEVETQLSKLNEIKSNLYTNYFLTKAHKINHYDIIRENINDLNEHSERLKFLLKDVEYYKKVQNSLENYLKHLKIKNQKFEYLISHLAVYNNFKKYYPKLLSTISQKLELNNKDLSLNILKLQRVIFQELDNSEYNSIIKNLKHQDTNSSEINYILTYTDSLMKNQLILETIEKEFLEINLSNDLQDIKNDFYEYQRFLENSKTKYHNLIILIICMLFVWIFYFILNLNRANQKIKETLKELNFQKSALDEHSIVSIADIKGNITYVNDKFCEISGYTCEELLGKNHRLLKSNEHDNTFFKELWDTISSGKVWKNEVKNKKKDGNFYWVDATIVPFLDDKGKPFKYVSIRTDITEEKKFKEELVEAKFLAEQSNKTKGQFLANMSHELRTPLNGIIGLSRLAAENEKNEEQKKLITKVLESGNLLLNIINDLLDYSKIEAGKLTIEHKDFSMQKAINTIEDLLKIKALEKNLEMNITIDKEIPAYLIGDSLRITQIILNIMGNAIKFTHNGSVSLSITILEKNFDTCLLGFKISDTGIGMDENTLKNIFESFSQADSSISRKYGGTGLGLTISKELIESMNGKLDVQSSLGIGTTFNIEIPFNVSKNLNKPEKEDKKTDSIVIENIKVLLVDDNEVNRLIACSVFESFGCITTTANDGLEAIEKLKTNSKDFDIVFMDIQMPTMNGYEATKIIREELKLNIPIIAMTANAMEEDINKALESGMNKHIRKPINPQEMKDSLKEFVQK